MKKITIVFLIIFSCIAGLLYAQSLTQAVNNQEATCLAQAQQDNALMAQSCGRCAGLNADYQVQMNCANGYNSLVPAAVNGDMQIQQTNGISQTAPSLQVQGTVTLSMNVNDDLIMHEKCNYNTGECEGHIYGAVNEG